MNHMMFLDETKEKNAWNSIFIYGMFFILAAEILLGYGCKTTVSYESPRMRLLSFDVRNGEPSELIIKRYTKLEVNDWNCIPESIVCQAMTQRVQISPVQGQVYVYCSFPMGVINPAPYESNQPTGYQTVTLGQNMDGRFIPILRFGMVDDDRTSGKGMANYVPGVYDGQIGYFGMYARPGTTYDFKMNLNLSKNIATVWVAGQGDDTWFPLAIDVPLMNFVTAINAVRIDQLEKAPGIENLVIQSSPCLLGERIRPHPLAKKKRIVEAGNGFRFQSMKSLWRDASRHVTVARTPNTQTPGKENMGWWLGFPDITQTSSTSLVAVYVDGATHGGAGQLWAKHSSDQGKTWHDPLVIYPGPCNSPHIQTLRDGSLLALADLWGENDVYPNVFFRSTDGGYTWTQIGRLDPVKAGGAASCVASRIVELSNGDWLTVASQVADEKEGETMVFYKSSDCGWTWSHFLKHNPPYRRVFSEGVMVPLPDGRLILIARDTPGVRMFSSDQGKTWSEPEDLPFGIEGRPCAALLQDGRLFLTFRHAHGLPTLWGWVANPDEPLPSQFVYGAHINDRTSVGLKGGGLYLDSDGMCGQFTKYTFHVSKSNETRVEITAELKVLANAGRSATISIPYVGMLRVFPDKVRFSHIPSSEIPISSGDFHAYRVIREGSSVSLFIDGKEVLSTEIADQEKSAGRYPLEFGNEATEAEAAAFEWAPGLTAVKPVSSDETSSHPTGDITPLVHAINITPSVTGCSIWKRFAARFEDPRMGVKEVSWSAESGEFPDQYQLDRIIEINGSISGWDQGYNGWTQLEDGRILILNYTDDTARFNRTYPDGGASWIRGTFILPKDLPGSKSAFYN